MGNQPTVYEEKGQPHNFPENATCILPCNNLWEMKEGKSKVSRWTHTLNVLSKHSQISSPEQLENLIVELNLATCQLPGLTYLLKAFSEEEKKSFYTKTLPFIFTKAKQIAELFPEGELRLLVAKPNDAAKAALKDGQDINTVKLSRLQIVSLLSHAFLCNLPEEQHFGDERFPDPNFTCIYGVKDVEHQLAKFRHLVHYFDRMEEEERKGSIEGFVTFKRLIVEKPPAWRESTELLTKVTVFPSGYIEDADNAIHVDFANKCIGGGVLQTGCVQEEIRFSVSTELLASLIFVSHLNDNEALLLNGSQRYSKYTGYGKSWRYDGDFVEKLDRDSSNELPTPIIAIDALPFGGKENLTQFEESFALRELNKAYAGFKQDSSLPPSFPIATGNWGCGVFGGEVQLKSLIQWIAASQSKREMLYYAFGDKCSDTLQQIANQLVEKKYTVGKLWTLVSKYDPYSAHKNVTLFEYIKSSEGLN